MFDPLRTDLDDALGQLDRIKAVLEAKRAAEFRAVDTLIQMAQEAEKEIALPLLDAAKRILERKVG